MFSKFGVVSGGKDKLAKGKGKQKRTGIVKQS